MHSGQRLVRFQAELTIKQTKAIRFFVATRSGKKAVAIPVKRR
jgi:hypothetical protein